MKMLCLILTVALSMSGCSVFSKSARMDRAYDKQLKKARVARDKRRSQLIRHQRAEMPSLRNTPPPLQQQPVQSTPEENQ